MPLMLAWLGLIGTILPPNLLVMSCCTSAPRMREGSADAPMTATDLGQKKSWST